MLSSVVQKAKRRLLRVVTPYRKGFSRDVTDEGDQEIVHIEQRKTVWLEHFP
jgi:hypothetical protein